MEQSEFGEGCREYNFGRAKSFCELLHGQIVTFFFFFLKKKGGCGGRKRFYQEVKELFSLKDFRIVFPPEIGVNEGEKGTPMLLTLLWLQAEFRNCSRQVQSAI